MATRKPNRLWIFVSMGLASVLTLLTSAAGRWNGVLGKIGPVRMVWVRSTQQLGLTPVSWPTFHRSFNNNDAFIDSGAPSGPSYLMQLPTLVSSDSPVVNHRLWLNLSEAGRHSDEVYPGFTMAILPRNGHVLWKQQVPNSVPSEPIVADNMVFVGEGNAVFRSHFRFPIPTILGSTVRGTGPSAVLAYSAASGRLIWKHPTVGSDQPSPTLYRGRLYVVNGSRRLDVLDPKTGRLIWGCNLGVYVSRSSPRIAKQTLYVGGGGPDEVVAVNLVTHRVIWRDRFLKAIGAVDDTPLALSGNQIYGEAMVGSPYIPLINANHHQMLFALNALNGRLLWRRKLAFGFEPRYKQGSTPMIHGNVVYVGTAINGKFFAFNRFTGKLLWVIRLPDPVTRPAVWVRGHIVGVTTHGLLFSVNSRGSDLHTLRIARWVNAFGPVLIDRTLFVAGNSPHDGYLAAVPLNRLIPAVVHSHL